MGAAPVAAVLFDKDGTLFDFQASWADWTRRLLDDLAGGDPSRVAAMSAAIGFDPARGRFRADSPVVAGTPEDTARPLAALLPEIGRDTLEARIADAASEARMVPPVPLVPLMAELAARGLALGVATNDAEAAARVHLRREGIEGLFAFVAGYDSGHGAKPAPGQLLAFARHCGVAPAQVVMVGDSLHDLHAARDAGMRRVAVLTGLATRETLAPHAESVLADVGGLPGWLDARSGAKTA